MYKKTINNVTYKTRSELKSEPTGFSVYKTVFRVGNEQFVYYGKQAFNGQPDMSYIGSGRRVQEKLAEMNDSDIVYKIVLQNFESEQEAYDFESECIQSVRKAEVNILNISKGNSGGKVFDKMTEEQIKQRNAKISMSMMGHEVSPETRRKISESKTGKKHSSDTCKKISESMKGRKTGPKSEETKRRMSEAHKARHAKA
ncbi:TPA: NUMOD3 domain-containing DNA-binding protein [Enterobacter hormaechei subsp. xiangfangensis]|uniref:NUMOD3 domain-containing DNA-binding protein n=1 Tax=Enterobacter cloacae TaxID=550 RepID=UPI002FD05D51